MAGNLLKIGKDINAINCEFAVDAVDEVDLLPTTTEGPKGIFANDPNFQVKPPIGSTCIVGNEGGDLLVYMLFSFGWKEI